MCCFASSIAVKSGESVRVYMFKGEDSHTKIRKHFGLREAQSLGGHDQYLVPLELRPVGYCDILNPATWSFYFDDGRPYWWTDAMTRDARRQMETFIRIHYIDGKTISTSGNLWLSFITSIDDSVTLSAGGDIRLSSITSIGDDVVLSSGGILDLNSVTSIGHSVTLFAGSSLFFYDLMSIVNGAKIKCGGKVFHRGDYITLRTLRRRCARKEK